MERAAACPRALGGVDTGGARIHGAGQLGRRLGEKAVSHDAYHCPPGVGVFNGPVAAATLVRDGRRFVGMS